MDVFYDLEIWQNIGDLHYECQDELDAKPNCIEMYGVKAEHLATLLPLYAQQGFAVVITASIRKEHCNG